MTVTLDMINLDETHDPARKSWVESANLEESDFPIQNLPFGVFDDGAGARCGVAIGDWILDLTKAESALPVPSGIFAEPRLNSFMALGPTIWRNTRLALSNLLDECAAEKPDWLVSQDASKMLLPFQVPGFTDFYSSREHATNVGTMFRGADKALNPNWLHIPIGYNGRASTVVVSGTDVHRPMGQLKGPNDDAPRFGPCEKLDIELELGAVVGVPNAMGTPIDMSSAEEAIFGHVLLNDWSARDIQFWEYQPLGPFQSKAFATTISPWVVTTEALKPFKVPGPAQEPTPLPYLQQHGPRGLDIDLSISLMTDECEAITISKTNYRHMYWSAEQQLAHHSAGGCAMNTGDILGSGTISGPTPGSYGSLLELTWNGRDPIKLPNGSQRIFLEDGDSVTLNGHCQGEGYRIGFGKATGRIAPI